MNIIEITDILLKGGPGAITLILAYLLWTKTKKQDDPGPKHDIIWEKMLEMEEVGDKTKALVHKLYEMHDVKDEDGIPVWHIRRSMIREQSEIRKVLSDLHQAIKDIHITQKRQTEVLEKLIDTLTLKNVN